MKICVIEKLILTKEEMEILAKTRDILDNIYCTAKNGGEIENEAWDGLGVLDFLLDEEISEIE